MIHRPGASGLGLSYAEAFPRAAATAVDVICQMDADLSHDPQYLPQMVAATEHYDVVIGSSYAEGPVSSTGRAIAPRRVEAPTRMCGW